MGGKKNQPVIEYNFRWSRSKNNVEPLIDGFSGYMMTDGLSHYNTTADEYNETHEDKIIHCSCNAHARRKYYDAWGKMVMTWMLSLPWNITTKSTQSKRAKKSL